MSRSTLLIVLDGVPYVCWKEAWEAQEEKLLLSPSRLISSFPSLTDAAFAEAFAWPEVDCYGSIILDRSRGILRPRLGAATRVPDDTFAFMSSDGSFLVNALASVARTHSNSAIRFGGEVLRQSLRRVGKTWAPFFARELAAAALIVQRSTAPHIRIVLNSLDEMAHREGLESMTQSLPSLFAWLSALSEESGRAVAIFSDHGNAPTAFHFVDYAALLRNEGFQVQTRLFAKGRILIPLYSTVTFFPVYLVGEALEPVAKFLAEAPGVDFVAYRAEPGDTVKVRRREVVSTISSGASGPVGAFAECPEEYPFASERIWCGMQGALSSADIVVSLKNDTVYGLPLVHRIYAARCMHGNLTRSASEGFLAFSSDYPRLREPRDTERLSALPRILARL